MIRPKVTLGMVVTLASGLLGPIRPGVADGPGQRLSTKAPGSQGCRLILSLPRASFDPSDPIPIYFEIVNASLRDVVMSVCTVWENHIIEVRDEHGQLLPLTEVGGRLCQHFSPGAPRDGSRLIRPEPGGRHRYGTKGAKLRQLFWLNLGWYRIKVIHEDDDESATRRCVSNWVDFEVK